MVLRVLTPVSKKASIYSDFHKDLTLSPVSNDIALLKDEEAVKEAIRNLLLTDPGERPMQPNLGGGIRGLLFENMTPGVLKLIQDRVETTIKTFEPRARLIDVTVATTFDENQVGVRVQFYIVNSQQPIELDVILERIR